MGKRESNRTGFEILKNTMKKFVIKVQGDVETTFEFTADLDSGYDPVPISIGEKEPLKHHGEKWEDALRVARDVSEEEWKFLQRRSE